MTAESKNTWKVYQHLFFFHSLEVKFLDQNHNHRTQSLVQIKSTGLDFNSSVSFVSSVSTVKQLDSKTGLKNIEWKISALFVSLLEDIHFCRFPISMIIAISHLRKYKKKNFWRIASKTIMKGKWSCWKMSFHSSDLKSAPERDSNPSPLLCWPIGLTDPILVLSTRLCGLLKGTPMPRCFGKVRQFF